MDGSGEAAGSCLLVKEVRLMSERLFDPSVTSLEEGSDILQHPECFAAVASRLLL